MYRNIERMYTVNIDVSSDGDVKFPDKLPFDGRCVYGIIAHLNNSTNTRKNVNGTPLVDYDSSVFVRLEGTEKQESQLQYTPLEALSIQGKNIPYIPIKLGKLDNQSCAVRVAGYLTGKDGNKSVMLSFITE